MKKQLFIALGLTFAIGTSVFAQEDPILMEVNGKKITQSEFLQIYLKNNNSPKYDQQTLDEYIELFKKFQLKVAEAEALGYDTIPKLRKELEGYQKQLAQPYLTDKVLNDALIEQAYNRMKSEVRASHMLVKVDLNANPEDTLVAYKKAMDLRSRLLKGEDFETLAKSKHGSEDPSVMQNGGDLGYFTAFQMVYPFENAAFESKVGDITMPIRTRFGYHILKITDKRDARGTMRAAHLMIAANSETDGIDVIEKARSKAWELHDKMKKGEKFEDLVRSYSDDQASIPNGGQLPVFGSGASTRMIPVFEEAAFALKKDNDISEPVQSNFGFHIIKRLELTPLKSFAELKKEIETKVNRDDRANLTQDSYLEKLKVAYKFEDTSKDGLKNLTAIMDSSIYVGKLDLSQMSKNLPLFTIDKKTFTAGDYGSFLTKNTRLVRGKALKDIANANYKEYVKQTVIEIEKEKLPSKHPEYKALMNEYHDGILLYEIMSDKVWNKAIRDTTGLQEFYNANKSKYMWDKRYDAVVYETMSEDIAKKVVKLAKKKIHSDSIAKVINVNTELNLKVRNGKFELNKTPYLTNPKLKVGVNKAYKVDEKFYVVDLKQIIPAKPKELNEAKGLITSEYQTYLEKEWLKELEQKHTIKINKDVLYSLGK